MSPSERKAAYIGLCLYPTTPKVITSEQIGSQLGLGSTQVRRDMASYGVKGKRGGGYSSADIALLIRTIDPRRLGEAVGIFRTRLAAVETTYGTLVISGGDS